MSHRLHLMFALLMSALLFAAAPVQAADPTPDEVLKSNGLTKAGVYYLLDADRKLVEQYRATQATKKKVDETNARHANLERDIQSAVAKMKDLDSQNRAETEKLDKMQKEAYASYNRQVEKVNGIRTNLRDGLKYIDKRQQTLQDFVDPTDEYVAQVLKYSDAMDAVAAQYKVLAEKDDVKAALSKLNEAAKPPMKLGPSEWFQQEYPRTQKLKASVATASIKFDFFNGVPEVPVTLNGTVTIDMIVDSGASIVSLTTETADKLGLKPGPNDKVIQLHSADGKVTEAHLMKLKSIRLGNFTVENVECAVSPPEVKGNINLLGGTFLKHFVYKMDIGAGVLRLSQISNADEPTTKPSK